MSTLNIKLGTEFCEEAFPLHLILDRDLNVLHVSDKLQKLIANIEIGLNFQNFIIEEKSVALLGAAEIQGRIYDSFVFLSKENSDFRLHSGFYPVGNENLLLVCSPIISNTRDIKKFALNFNDFPRHDPVLNHISVVQTKDSAFNDMRALTDRLENQVEERTKELSESMNEAVSANQAKSEFLSSMSHELRTPMNAILGFGQMLEIDSPHPLTDQQKLCVDHILNGGNHLLELIDQVLDLATIESGHVKLSLEEVALDEVCLECMSLIENQALEQGLSIDKSLGVPRAIKADYTRLKQVLLNLLSNAIKYNRKGGSISVAIEDAPNDMIRVSVTDTGHGISEDQQPYLFEPFNRLGKEGGHIEGSGIGLTITKTMVEAMDGSIGVESTLGKGSTFWLDFPRVEFSNKNSLFSVEANSRSGSESQSSTTGTILYVEDNPANVDLMEMIIGRIEGLSMSTAHNAERGIIMAEESLPNLILMDINLPGMNGIKAMQILQNSEKTKNIPVIAITAAAMERDIKKGEAAGFKAYLTKPFNVEEIVETINKILDAK